MSIMSNFAMTAVFATLLGAAANPADEGKQDDAKALAEAKLRIAKRAFDGTMQALVAPPVAGAEGTLQASIMVERLALWSRRWMQAESDLDPAARVKAIRDHIARMERALEIVRELAKGAGSGLGQRDVDTLDYELQDARWLLLEAQGKQ